MKFMVNKLRSIKLVNEFMSKLGKNILWMFSVLVLIIVGFSTCYANASFFPSSLVPVTRLTIFILAGLITGLFYGINNHWIFHDPKNKTNESPLNKPAETNQFWIHIICGIVGAIALYFLSFKLDFVNPQNVLSRLGSFDLLLFILAILGYTGLLPRALWFFASARGFPGSSKES